MAASDPQKPKRSVSADKNADAIASEKVASDALQDTVIPSGPNDAMKTTMASGGGTVKKSAAKAAAAQRKQRQAGGAAGQAKKLPMLGEFQLERKLGQGGMGEVWLANQTSLDRLVAIKILSKEMAKKPGFVERFTREARSMAKIDHVNAVKVYAATADKGLNFVAIEYIDGQSMQDWIDKLGKLEVGDALNVVLLCADALKYAHDLNLIHRDIKPDNILVTKKGVVKVADFGLAKALDDEDMSMTQSGTGLGTPLYMPPEQARDAKNVDHRTDIYALGCTLYYFLTGKLPFESDSMLKLIIAKEAGKFKPARELNKAIPERLDLMIDKMMAKEPAHRYAGCDELIADLDGLNLTNPALSFIDGAQPAAAQHSTASRSAQSSRAATSATVAPDMSKPIDYARTSAEDAEAQAEKKLTKEDGLWFVKHKNAQGKVVISKLTTQQIQQGLKGNILDVRAQAKKSLKGTFLPLSQYAEFTSLMKQRLVQAKADQRSNRLKDMYAKIDSHERTRKRRRWFHRLKDGALGWFGLVLYISALCAAIFGLVKVAPYVFKFVAEQLGIG